MNAALSKQLPGRDNDLRRQRGAVTLVMALLILTVLAILVLASTRMVLVQHRISANSTRADAAFAAAEGGVQNALSYLNANRNVVADVDPGGWLHADTDPRWQACDPNDTNLPCGDGTNNLYDGSWFALGPLNNQLAPPAAHNVSSWLLSDSIARPQPQIPYLECLHLGLTALLAPVTVPLVNTLNGILGTLLGPLLGQPGLGLPTELCLPINFQQMPPAPLPSQINPSITVVSSATPNGDIAGGAAAIQQVVGATNLFATVPPAVLTVDGSVNLQGDIRLYGNPRPPTIDPVDFSVLNLNNVIGIDLTALLNALLGSTASAISDLINISLDPLLNTTTAEVLNFDWNVTFPLTIWSANNTTLGTTRVRGGLLGTSILSGARTCDPRFAGPPDSPCLPFSQSLLALTLLGVPLAPLLPLELPDVQDPVNLLSVVGGLLGNSVPPFPGDLFQMTFGYPSADSDIVQEKATVVSDCSALGDPGFYWVTGNCGLSGTVGTVDDPMVIVAAGNVSMAAGTEYNGALYLRGNGNKSFSGPSSGTRPTLRGAVISEGNFSGADDFNLVYDVNVLRAAGFLNGGFAPVPGGWNDALLGP